MFFRKTVAAFSAAATLSMTVAPAFALEIREPRAHLAFNIPDGWNVDQEGRYVRAAPRDGSFHLRVVGIDHAWGQDKEAEDQMLSILNEHIDGASIDMHAHHIDDWHGFEGVEIRGHGRRKFDNHEGKFFALSLRDRHDPKKGVVALGIGTPEGFDRHHPGIYDALHSMHTW
jgi:hypothetical protein